MASVHAVEQAVVELRIPVAHLGQVVPGREHRPGRVEHDHLRRARNRARTARSSASRTSRLNALRRSGRSSVTRATAPSTFNRTACSLMLPRSRRLHDGSLSADRDTRSAAGRSRAPGRSAPRSANASLLAGIPGSRSLRSSAVLRVGVHRTSTHFVTRSTLRRCETRAPMAPEPTVGPARRQSCACTTVLTRGYTCDSHRRPLNTP